MNNFQIPIYIPVIFDHLKDVNDIARKTLISYGIKPVEKDAFYLQLLNFYSKHIEQRPRKVIVSKFLNVPEKYKNGYEKLIKKIELGQNLNQYLTTNIEKPHFNDHLLNTEGLFHFHLGEQLAEKHKKFRNRYFEKTTDILIAKVTSNHVYLLTIEPHESTDWNEDDFGSISAKKVTFFHDKYLKIIAKEFPNLISHRKLPKTQPEIELTTKEKVFLKNNNITSMTSVGEDSYMDIPIDSRGYSVENLSRYNLLTNSVACDMKYSIKPYLYTLGLTNLEKYEIQLFSFKDIRNKIYKIKIGVTVIAIVMNIDNMLTIAGTIKTRKRQEFKGKVLSTEIDEILYYGV